MSTSMFFLPAATDPRWPRAAILGLWTFTGLLGRAYRRPIVPLLGFILVPWSTVFYAVERGRSGPRQWLSVAALPAASAVRS